MAKLTARLHFHLNSTPVISDYFKNGVNRASDCVLAQEEGVSNRLVMSVLSTEED